ncbi:LeoA/HP0731 family dynamin-like GTPase [Luteimonas sp. A478]
MNTTLDRFKAQQDNAIGLLRDLLAFLKDGQDFGVVMDKAFEDKLTTAIDAVSGERLKVALVGGFSEGKTAIAAAWLNRLDDEGMKISQEESTDDVLEYEVGDNLLLVDTPGLYGSRKVDGEAFKNLTRKYVSEANLALYVMDPVNPIKESHKEELEWLFLELGLLSRTVFVLSRFDDVANLEDETVYQAALQVKATGIRQRLVELVGLPKQEVNALSIVAVAANPFNQGIDYWIENEEQYRKLSHIETLQKATEDKIHSSGGTDKLVAETRTAIIGDVLGKHLPMAIERGAMIDAEVDRLTDTVQELSGQLDQAFGQAQQAESQIRRFLIDYYPDLILQAKGADLQTWSNFFEREVGAEGIIIRMRLQDEYAKVLRTVQLNMEALQASFVGEINHFNTVISSLGEQGVKYLLDGKVINNKSILMFRDGVVSVGKKVGVDLSKNLKFAPWGAHNLAKGVNGGLAVLGVAIELWDTYQSYEKEKKFREGLELFVTTLENQRKSLASELEGSGDESVFLKTYFPDLLELKDFMNSLKAALEEMSQKKQRFTKWYQQADALKGEYKHLRAG